MNPLIVLHDVCWPTDRCDSYCIPSFLEDPGPYTTTMALRPDSEELFQIGAVPADDRIARAFTTAALKTGFSPPWRIFSRVKRGSGIV